MTPATLAALLAARTARRPVVLATHLSDGAQIIWPDTPAPPALAAAAQAALTAERGVPVTLEDGEWFLEARTPPLRLFVVGAVHIAQTLVPMAAMAGFAVTVIDPRAAFATAERFPDAALVVDWPDTALDALAPDARTAVVTLAHDPKIDDPALARALASEAFYIGALGSRGSQAARLERLAALGFSPAALARIHGPVGLPLGALTPAEIAVSILSELVAVHRGSPLGRRAAA